MCQCCNTRCPCMPFCLSSLYFIWWSKRRKYCIELEFCFVLQSYLLEMQMLFKCCNPHFCLLDPHPKCLSLCDTLQKGSETGARGPSCGRTRKCVITALISGSSFTEKILNLKGHGDRNIELYGMSDKWREYHTI